MKGTLRKIDSQAFNGRLYVGAWQATKATPDDQQHLRVTLWADNRCPVLFDQRVGSEDKGVNAIGAFLGTLQIVGADGADNEKWVIFDAAGYEGFAQLALRLVKKGNITSDDVDFYNIR